MDDKQVYWDEEHGQFYWIEWEETGNNDIPHRRYIRLDGLAARAERKVAERRRAWDGTRFDGREAI